jgi:aryl-alcohol dehydrogenase (NADP+)
MFGWQTDERTSLKVIDAAIDSGINLLDTANIYGQGASEKIVGQAIRGRRDRCFVATKVFGRMEEAPFERGLSREHILSACEASLNRLGTDYIDLYQLHRPDPTTPIEETLSALSELVMAGKVRAIGTSTFHASQIEEAQEAALSLGMPGLASEQSPYNLLEREVDRKVSGVCQKWGIGLLTWSPLAGGLLTGKYDSPLSPPLGSRFQRWHKDLAPWRHAFDCIAELKRWATTLDVPLSHLALAWLRNRPGVSSVIIGPRSPSQLRSYVASLDFTVPAEINARIDLLIPPGETLLNLYND